MDGKLGAALSISEFETLHSVGARTRHLSLPTKDIAALEALSFIRRHAGTLSITELGIFRLALGRTPRAMVLLAAIKCYELANFPKDKKPARKPISLVSDARREIARPQPLRPILLVEDNPTDIELVRHALTATKVLNDVVVARDGVEALDHLLATHSTGLKPAVIFLDIKMPRIDGFEVLDIIKKDDRLRAIPVVMLTSSTEKSDRMKSYELGANAFAIKPVSSRQYAQTISDIAAFWSQHDAAPY